MRRQMVTTMYNNQEYLMAFKLMTSQVVQRALPLGVRIFALGSQRVNAMSVKLI